MKTLLGQLLVVGWLLCVGEASAATTLEWRLLPELPEVSEGVTQPGVAGPFVGGWSMGDTNVLMVAGGANFPEGLPWETKEDGTAPPKIYYDEIFVMEDTGAGWSWSPERWKLPHPVGYGANVTHGDELICIGGESKGLPVNGSQTKYLYDDVYSLKWTTGGVVLDLNFPALPEPTAMLVAAMVNDVIYVAGGDSGNGATTHFWSLDLGERENDGWAWEILKPWPGQPRVLALAVGQGDSFYLFSGRNPTKEKVELLKDAWSYHPASDAWKRRAELPRCVMAGTAVASGNAHALVFGGAEGDLFRKLDYEIPAGIVTALEEGDQARVDALAAEKLDILNNHSGFNKEVLAYHTVTDTWVPIGKIDGLSPVTTSAIRIGDRILIPSGEISPGIRTRQVLELRMNRERSFGGLNYTVLGIYLIGVLINGFYFSRKMRNTNDYFKAGGRIPWWAAGLSIFGTQLSAITFIAIPAKVFSSDWRLMVGQFAILMIAPFVIFFFLPFYRKLNVTTAYEYLEARFNVFVRCCGSVMFMLLQFARIGIVLYLPSVALAVVTGMSVDLCILVMGVLCLIYTVSGGME
ncbi:sodium transporter, partial [Verrucomicrobia bacterium]|nr:sodium transporter [Verrucomicrobiota bacterium]